MDIFITQLQDHELTHLPEIPDYYSQLRFENCICIAAFDGPDRKTLMGLFVIRLSDLYPADTDTRYIWIRPVQVAKKVFTEMIRYTIGLYKNSQIKSTLFRTTTTGEEYIGFFTDALTDGLGLMPVKESCIFGGWYVQDIFDTEFIGKKMPALAADPSLVRMAGMQTKKAERLIEGMMNASLKPMGIPETESPFSYFYIRNDKPVAAMTAELVYENTVLLTGFYSRDNIWEDEVFSSLTAAVLDAALEGLGLDAQVIFRLTDPAVKDRLEALLGTAEVSAEQRLYRFYAKSTTDDNAAWANSVK